ncbi:MAG TPA: flagellar type III secretion system pore protein FliP [Calditrichia bacterium]|nr:flagellar type III secretion system pore protein FliP [Calditrichota bacterium]HQU70655.1 flagellar type III secretion system pore protein FliP [Calditrichia bacterium]HQV30397.1 flagellar type III secretion system pore protein FliP [Calditrichia bacterium]
MLLGSTSQLAAQQTNPQNPLPRVTVGVEESQGADDFVPTIQIVILLTILSLAPSIMIMMTSFTRIIIIFHFLRQSLSTQTVPPNQILAGLALFLTFFIMKPVLTEINDNALQPYIAKEISQKEALERAVVPLRAFMLKQTREKDLKLFVDLQDITGLEGPDDIPISTLIPAFIISELKTAFQIGFLLYLPMILLDLVVGSILLSMGMMMLPPAMISMPFKILLFVLVDGWHLMIESIVKGF